MNTNSIPPLGREIKYNRESREYDMYVIFADGKREYIGTAQTYHAAELKLDQYAYEYIHQYLNRCHLCGNPSSVAHNGELWCAPCLPGYPVRHPGYDEAGNVNPIVCDICGQPGEIDIPSNSFLCPDHLLAVILIEQDIDRGNEFSVHSLRSAVAA